MYYYSQKFIFLKMSVQHVKLKYKSGNKRMLQGITVIRNHLALHILAKNMYV